MQSYNSIRKALTVDTNVLTGNSTYTFTDWRYRFVTASTLIHGDRKSEYPHAYRKEQIEAWMGSRTVGLFRVEGNLGGQVPSLPPGTEWVTDRVALFNQALDRMYEMLRGGLDLSIDLAEAGKTKSMLNAHKRFKDHTDRTLYNKIAHGRSSGRFGLIKGLGSKWLEWQYGVRPLLSSIYDAHNELVNGSIKRMWVKGNVTRPLKSSVTHPSVTWGHPMQSESVGFASCRIKSRWKPPTSAYDVRRWSSFNPVSIGYELITLSFVYDWFVDVGGYLRNLETALLYAPSFETGSIRYLYVVNSKHSIVFDGGFGNQVVGTASSQLSDFQRQVMLGAPTPYGPRFTAKLGWERLLTAASLLAPFLGRGKNEFPKQPRLPKLPRARTARLRG